jgi:hypothetical protein
LSNVHDLGMKCESVIVDGALNDSDTIHNTGTATIATTMVFAAPHAAFCPVLAAI